MSIEERFLKSPRGKKYLQKKIAQNMEEWKKGRWASQKQALAVSYSETRQYFDRISKKKKKNSRRKRNGKK